MLDVLKGSVYNLHNIGGLEEHFYGMFLECKGTVFLAEANMKLISQKLLRFPQCVYPVKLVGMCCCFVFRRLESLRIVGNASGTQSTSHQSCSKSSKTFLGCSLI